MILKSISQSFPLPSSDIPVAFQDAQGKRQSLFSG